MEKEVAAIESSMFRWRDRHYLGPRRWLENALGEPWYDWDQDGAKKKETSHLTQSPLGLLMSWNSGQNVPRMEAQLPYSARLLLCTRNWSLSVRQAKFTRGSGPTQNRTAISTTRMCTTREPWPWDCTTRRLLCCPHPLSAARWPPNREKLPAGSTRLWLTCRASPGSNTPPSISTSSTARRSLLSIPAPFIRQ